MMIKQYQNNSEHGQAQDKANVNQHNLVSVQACRGITGHCPNRVIPKADWLKAIEEWLTDQNINQKLLDRAKSSKALSHKGLKIAISGCANGCARHQIADLGLVGEIRPIFDPLSCTACEACVNACPDNALKLIQNLVSWNREECQGCKTCANACEFEAIAATDPQARLLVGGKLGRHPSFAKELKRVKTPKQAVMIFSTLFDRFLKNAGPNQRFSAWWAQIGKAED